MVTFRVLGVVSLLGFVACGGGVIDVPGLGSSSSSSGSGSSGSGSSGGGSSGSGVSSGGTGTSYSGKGFVVHEWGTNTVVVGSDGSMQAGMHHEEEDLPSFVFDRVKEGNMSGGFVDKMETPVIYFYSDSPKTVRTQVAFPKGIFSQWYPAVDSFQPLLAFGSSPNTLSDPVLDPKFDASKCPSFVTELANGSIEWSNIEILDRASNVDSMLANAPLDQYTWSHARAVASNPIRVQSAALGTQLEKFLFYRGLGNSDMPAKVTAVPSKGSPMLAIENDANDAIASAFVISVQNGQGAFQELGDVGPHATLPANVPTTMTNMNDFTTALGAAMTTALDRAGLFHDESVSMVNTWKRQWFQTPGTRVLYLAPQTWTDGLIPLTFNPAPDAITRIMMIRTEVLTPDVENADVPHARDWNGDATAQKNAAAYFMGLGRFGEPRMRRAIAMIGGSKTGETYLWQNVIARGQAGGALGE